MSTTQILKIFCDGGARGNPGPGAIGVVIKTEDGKIIHRFGKKIGIVTNNQAEYIAVLEAISWIAENEAPRPHGWGIFFPTLRRERNPSEAESSSRSSASLRSGFSAKGDENAKVSLPMKITFYLDSQLVALQLNGVYKLKNANLRALLIRVREKEAGIDANISYHHIPREDNSEADALVNQALDA